MCFINKFVINLYCRFYIFFIGESYDPPPPPLTFSLMSSNKTRKGGEGEGGGIKFCNKRCREKDKTYNAFFTKTAPGGRGVYDDLYYNNFWPIFVFPISETMFSRAFVLGLAKISINNLSYDKPIKVIYILMGFWFLER